MRAGHVEPRAQPLWRIGSARSAPSASGSWSPFSRPVSIQDLHGRRRRRSSRVEELLGDAVGVVLGEPAHVRPGRSETLWSTPSPATAAITPAVTTSTPERHGRGGEVADPHQAAGQAALQGVSAVMARLRSGDDRQQRRQQGDAVDEWSASRRSARRRPRFAIWPMSGEGEGDQPAGGSDRRHHDGQPRVPQRGGDGVLGLPACRRRAAGRRSKRRGSQLGDAHHQHENRQASGPTSRWGCRPDP